MHRLRAIKLKCTPKKKFRILKISQSILGIADQEDRCVDCAAENKDCAVVSLNILPANDKSSRRLWRVSHTAHNRMLGGCAKKTYMIIGVSGDNCWSFGPSISSANTSQISSLGLRKRKANTVSGCMATTIDDNTFPADSSPRISYTHVRTRKRIPTMSKRAKREFDRSWPPMRMQRSRPFQPYPVWKQTQTWSRLDYAQG